MSLRTSYEAYDHFTLRAPVLTLDFLHDIPATAEEIRPFMEEIWKNPIVKGGIELASPDLTRFIETELMNTSSAASPLRLYLSFLRYMTRFSSRCTPFGIFAGFATGSIGEEKNLKLTSPEGHQVHARPDMEYTMRLARLLIQDPEIRKDLLFRPNSSIYQVGARWHYVEIKFQPPSNKKIYDVVRIDDNGIIGNIFEFCRNGRKIEEIICQLAKQGWERDQIIPFLDSLIDSQVIVSDLEPIVSGREYFDYLVELVNERIESSVIANVLTRLLNQLDSINKPASIASGLTHIVQELRKLPLPVPEVYLIQADMMLGSDNLKLDRKLVNQILLGARILRAVSANDHMDALSRFKEAFLKRYGEREVPLVRILDPESGIGLDGEGEQYWTDPAPWIDDLRTGNPVNRDVYPSSRGNYFIVRRFLEAIQRGEMNIEITSRDLAGMDLHAGEWPNQITVMTELFLAENQGEIQVHLIHAVPGNPSNLLGRFAFADTGSTVDFIRQVLRDEEESAPGKILAEVVHLPEDRTGNVLQRPSILKYEIPYLARSLNEEEMQIPISDLMVSIKKGRAILRSARLGKEVIPKMTNAYNHSLGNLAIYKFLHRIQHQKNQSSWHPDWGETIRSAPFIPGIIYKNMVLTAPVWLIDIKQLASFIRADSAQLDHHRILEWKDSLRMPNEVLWISGDQELYINWTKPSLILAAWEVIRLFKLIRVRPFYFSCGSPLTGLASSHANQFLFCYHKT